MEYEIINSFIKIDEKERKINNGIIENRNKTIKNGKHNANGYSNWERFRSRVLYVINDDVTYYLYPVKKTRDPKISSRLNISSKDS